MPDGFPRGPKSMLSRLALVLAGAILLELLGNLALHRWQERELVDSAQTRLIAQQLVNAAHVAEAARPPQRVRLMHELDVEGLTLNWVPSTVITDHSEADERLSIMRERLVRLFPELGEREMRLTLLPGQGGKQRDLVGVLALRDGSFISFRVSRYLDAPPPPALVILLHLLLLFIVFGLALRMVRSLVRPLRDLAAAADGTGRARARQIVPEGPQEVRRLASAFAAMQARLLKITEDNTQALIGVSHDLRTPIQRMRLRASMLAEADAREAMAEDLAEMELFIDSALAYVRHGMDERARLVDVAALLTTAVDDAADQGADVGYRGPDSFILETRPAMLTRMVHNLLNNARRYASKIEVQLSGQEGANAEIRVEDDGPGIPADLRAAAMQPFRKLEPAGTPLPSRIELKQGVGLGLAYVHRTLEMQGGKLALGESRLGGLSASISIPAATGSEAVASSKRDGADRSAKTRKGPV